MCGYGGCSNPFCEKCKPKYLTCPRCGRRPFLSARSCPFCGLELGDDLKAARRHEWQEESRKPKGDCLERAKCDERDNSLRNAVIPPDPETFFAQNREAE